MSGHLKVHKKNTRFSYKPQRNCQFGKTKNKTMNTYYDLVSK